MLIGTKKERCINYLFDIGSVLVIPGNNFNLYYNVLSQFRQLCITGCLKFRVKHCSSTMCSTGNEKQRCQMLQYKVLQGGIPIDSRSRYLCKTGQ